MTRNFELSQLLKLESQSVFNEIANFENYENFIPGCSKASLLEKNEDYEIGELKFDFLLRQYSIKSKNIISDKDIKIEQVEGPFETFEGHWSVYTKGDQLCEVVFRAKFKLPFLLDNLVPDNVIEKFCEAALKSFLERVNKKG